MAHDWILYMAAFASAFGISLVGTPYAKKLSLRVGAIDYPRDRGMHTEPIPRMGGIAIVLGFMITMGILAVFLPDLRTKQFAGFVAGALIIAATGIIDDVFTLRARNKLFLQIAAALVVVLTGTRIGVVLHPITAYLESLSAPITLLWIIGVTNAVNLIDGVDGLAVGISSIGALCLMVLCILSGSQLAVVLTAALAGSCLGFLPCNFSPAELIMGDTGALFLGFVLSVSSIIGVFKGYALLAVLVAVFALALPITDTLFAIIRRAVNHKPIMEADRGHLHHKLIDAGYSHKQAVVILYGVNLLTGLVAIVIAIRDMRAIIVTAVFLLVMLAMLYVYRRRTQE